ncbi:MAG: helix-turn-helix domain-containing protein [Saprospiraceae bacterium]|jgi:transcriptional regulator with XRE-family HTH domain|nr:helix-turn-helix domain-containing protein [Saprospiraceae bacterium]
MSHFSILIKQIKERREMLKITQENLADLSGVGLRTIKQLEAGKANPTYRTLQEIADVLGLELVLQVKKLNNL